MKRSYTVVFILAAAVIAFLTHVTSPARPDVKNPPSDKEFHCSNHLQLIQQEGFIADNGKSGWKFLTRKYKPRSTKPTTALSIMEQVHHAAVRVDIFDTYSVTQIAVFNREQSAIEPVTELRLFHTRVEQKYFDAVSTMNVFVTA